MEFKCLSDDKPRHCSKPGSDIKQMTKNLEEIMNTHYSNIHIVCLAKGLIYPEDKKIDGIPRPIEVMVGNPNRKILPNFETSLPDMLSKDESGPRVKMSCGHAITPDNLFGHMRRTLMSEFQPNVRCCIENCNTEWDMQEIAKKADLTEDEKMFFEFKIAFNFMYEEEKDTSTCPSCGFFCQRKQNILPTRCVVCTKKTGKYFDFCWRCKLPWNGHTECNSRKNEIQELLNNAPVITMEYSKMKGVPSIRICPCCKNLIEHVIGCKTMTCTDCDAVFCFSCLTVAIGGKLQCTVYNRECPIAPVQRVL